MCTFRSFHQQKVLKHSQWEWYSVSIDFEQHIIEKYYHLVLPDTHKTIHFSDKKYRVEINPYSYLIFIGCLTVAVLHAMVIYAVYYRKRYFLIPWICQNFIEIAGAVAFGGLCGYHYFTCKDMCCVDDLGCLSHTFFMNIVISGGYSGFLIYMNTIAFMFYEHCVKTGDIDMFLEQAAKMATPLVVT